MIGTEVSKTQNSEVMTKGQYRINPESVGLQSFSPEQIDFLNKFMVLVPETQGELSASEIRAANNFAQSLNTTYNFEISQTFPNKETEVKKRINNIVGNLNSRLRPNIPRS